MHCSFGTLSISTRPSWFLTYRYFITTYCPAIRDDHPVDGPEVVRVVVYLNRSGDVSGEITRHTAGYEKQTAGKCNDVGRSPWFKIKIVSDAPDAHRCFVRGLQFRCKA